jgi:hypothetical protein
VAAANSASRSSVYGTSFRAEAEPLERSSIRTGAAVRTRASPAAIRSTYGASAS